MTEEGPERVWGPREGMHAVLSSGEAMTFAPTNSEQLWLPTKTCTRSSMSSVNRNGEGAHERPHLAAKEKKINDFSSVFSPLLTCP